ncbi:hypothetical protein [Emticicia sp. C21]|uniref:hypothetical protein n=1 Tax=Emticicia sp. C21 TaxID=2302915 RepID=UPI000E357399|nr:hypothetical protein [Emticicia sp. C21]RFS16846.1 hypothetical protein D0T08_09200 [Emticicia sp. C21]
MKTTHELKKILSSELNETLKTLHSLKKSTYPDYYYNAIFGDASFILAGILEQLLNESYHWGTKSGKWMDDALIEDFHLYEERLSINGVMIWGKGDTTEQWVEPFYFDVELNKNEVNMEGYNLYFGNTDNPAIPYTYFSNNREYWQQDLRNWEYQLMSK